MKKQLNVQSNAYDKIFLLGVVLNVAEVTSKEAKSVMREEGKVEEWDGKGDGDDELEVKVRKLELGEMRKKEKEEESERKEVAEDGKLLQKLGEMHGQLLTGKEAKIMSSRPSNCKKRVLMMGDNEDDVETFLRVVCRNRSSIIGDNTNISGSTTEESAECESNIQDITQKVAIWKSHNFVFYQPLRKNPLSEHFHSHHLLPFPSHTYDDDDDGTSPYNLCVLLVSRLTLSDPALRNHFCTVQWPRFLRAFYGLRSFAEGTLDACSPAAIPLLVVLRTDAGGGTTITRDSLLVDVLRSSSSAASMVNDVDENPLFDVMEWPITTHEDTIAKYVKQNVIQGCTEIRACRIDEPYRRDIVHRFFCCLEELCCAQQSSWIFWPSQSYNDWRRSIRKCLSVVVMEDPLRTLNILSYRWRIPMELKQALETFMIANKLVHVCHILCVVIYCKWVDNMNTSISNNKKTMCDYSNLVHKACSIIESESIMSIKTNTSTRELDPLQSLKETISSTDRSGEEKETMKLEQLCNEVLEFLQRVTESFTESSHESSISDQAHNPITNSMIDGYIDNVQLPIDLVVDIKHPQEDKILLICNASIDENTTKAVVNVVELHFASGEAMSRCIGVGVEGAIVRHNNGGTCIQQIQTEQPQKLLMTSPSKYTHILLLEVIYRHIEDDEIVAKRDTSKIDPIHDYGVQFKEELGAIYCITDFEHGQNNQSVDYEEDKVGVVGDQEHGIDEGNKEATEACKDPNEGTHREGKNQNNDSQRELSGSQEEGGGDGGRDGDTSNERKWKQVRCVMVYLKLRKGIFEEKCNQNNLGMWGWWRSNKQVKLEELDDIEIDPQLTFQFERNGHNRRITIISETGFFFPEIDVAKDFNHDNIKIKVGLDRSKFIMSNELYKERVVCVDAKLTNVTEGFQIGSSTSKMNATSSSISTSRTMGIGDVITYFTYSQDRRKKTEDSTSKGIDITQAHPTIHGNQGFTFQTNHSSDYCFFHIKHLSNYMDCSNYQMEFLKKTVSTETTSVFIPLTPYGKFEAVPYKFNASREWSKNNVSQVYWNQCYEANLLLNHDFTHMKGPSVDETFVSEVLE